jgi:hypothetical protein
MKRYPQEKTTQLLEEPIETRPSLLHRLLARYQAWHLNRQLEHRRRKGDWQLERRLQEWARERERLRIWRLRFSQKNAQLERPHTWRFKHRRWKNFWQRERRREFHRRRELDRQLEHRRQEKAWQLASRLEELIIGCGLTQLGHTLNGDFNVHAPQVLSVDDGSPVRVDIHILPGQTPDHFANHARTIAYDLDLAEVRVVPLGPSRVRLELFQ